MKRNNRCGVSNRNTDKVTNEDITRTEAMVT